MFFAIYLLVCGVVTPVIIGFHIYKKFMKGVMPSENNRKPQENECES